MDYTTLWRSTVYFSFAGYVVGRFAKRPLTLAFVFPLPIIVKFAFDEYNLKQEGKYRSVYQYRDWEINKKINEIQEKTKQQKVGQQKKL